jgi:hypothetical protein
MSESCANSCGVRVSDEFDDCVNEWEAEEVEGSSDVTISLVLKIIFK